MPGIIALPKINYEDLEEIVAGGQGSFHIGNASRYIHAHYAYAIAFIVHSMFLVFSSHDDKVYNNERKRKRGRHYKTAATKRLSFFLSIKAYVKRSDVAYF